MPELPEVEFTARQLRATVIGAVISAVEIYWEPTIGHPEVGQFGPTLRGQRILAVRRRGKYVLLDLGRQNKPEWVLTVHRRMTGNLYLLPPGWIVDSSLRERDPQAWSTRGPELVPPDGKNTTGLNIASPRVALPEIASPLVVAPGVGSPAVQSPLTTSPVISGPVVKSPLIVAPALAVHEELADYEETDVFYDPTELTHCRVMLELNDGRKLLYNDSRKFGRLELWPHAQEHNALAGLGPEPLSPEFTLAVLTTNLSTRKGPIKAVLLNQEIVAGLGNIYADEALYMAAIHPLRPANGLLPDELARLHAAIVEVLSSSIAYGGTTFSGYRGLRGELGANYEHLKAYHRNGEEKICQRCGNVIVSQVIAQRTAHFCPVCQQ